MNNPEFKLPAAQTYVFQNTGLFGPDSVSWKVWSHPAAFVGLMRSFIIEMLNHPDGAAAVAQKGGYSRDPIGRLQRTMFYFLNVVFGDTAMVTAANERLERIHQRIEGTTSLTGRHYHAHDPMLMLGTHLITWHSVYYAYEQFVGGLTPAEEAAFFKESKLAAEVMKLDAEAAKAYARDHHQFELGSMASMTGIPEDREAYRQIFEVFKQGYAVTPEARDVVSMLISPHQKDADMRKQVLFQGAKPLSMWATLLVPRDMRRMAGLPTSLVWEKTLRVSGRAMVHTLAVPAVWRALQNEISPNGYALMRQAMATATT